MNQIKFNDFQKEYSINRHAYNSIFTRVLSSGWYILGREVSLFEEEYASYLGAKYCIGVANGLEALQISLMALGIGKGDQVITTPVSAAATTLAILAVSATPVFVDTDERGLIDTTYLQKYINKNTRAILPVDLYGQPAAIGEITRIAKKHNVSIVDDACQAHGTTIGQKKAGAQSLLGCFSFYPTKNLGAVGDGGAIVTNNKRLAVLCSQIRDYGQKEKYNHSRYGLNSRLDELQAALLRYKLQNLDKTNQKRRLLAKKYIARLSPIKDIQIVTDMVNESNFHLFVIRTKQRQKLKTFLTSHHIPTMIHYPTILPDQGFMKGKVSSKASLPKAREFVKEILSLPCQPYMSVSDVDFVSAKIKQFFEKK